MGIGEKKCFRKVLSPNGEVQGLPRPLWGAGGMACVGA